MHQGEVAAGQVAFPVVHDAGERHRLLQAQVAVDGVGAHQDREVDVGHQLEQGGVPFFRETRPRRQVARFALAGEVEVHGHDRDAAGVVEGGAVDAHPVAQPVAALVVPIAALLFGHAAGRLAYNQDARGRARGVERVDAAGGVVGVLRVVFDGVEDVVECGHGFGPSLWFHRSLCAGWGGISVVLATNGGETGRERRARGWRPLAAGDRVAARGGAFLIGPSASRVPPGPSAFR